MTDQRPPAGEPESGPRVRVELVERGARTQEGRWPLTWAVMNLDDALLQIEEAWLPHGRLLAERRPFTPPFRLGRGETARLEFLAAWHEQPGVEVENAFVILRVIWRDDPWRIFARLTVRSADDGAPLPRTELITLQRVELEV